MITNERTGSKRAYDDNLARPKFAMMNPTYTQSLPDYQTESGCVDIMMHTMERYFTNGGNMEITDAIAEGLLRTVMKNAGILHIIKINLLPILYQHLKRKSVVCGSNLAFEMQRRLNITFQTPFFEKPEHGGRDKVAFLSRWHEHSCPGCLAIQLLRLFDNTIFF